MGTGAGTKTRAVAEMETGTRMGTRGNEDGVGEGGREAKKRKKPYKSCRGHVGNWGDLGGKREKRRQGRVGSVTANPDTRENSKEAGGEAKGTQGLSKNCISRENMSSLSRLIRGFVISIIDPSLGGSMRVA